MITSVRNPRVQAAARLHKKRTRLATGHTLLEGPGPVGEAVAAGVTVVDAFYAPDDDAARADLGDVGVVVSPEVLARIAATEHPRGPVAVIATPPSSIAAGDLLVLVGLGDPGNAGTMIRSAAAFGFGIVATPGTVDLWAPKVLRAGAGAHFRTPIATAGPAWTELVRARDRRIGALVVSGGAVLEDLDAAPVALLVGEEASGLPDAVVREADLELSIAMPGGTESLNAAVAASIAMYVRSRHR